MSKFCMVGNTRRYAREICLIDKRTVGGGLSAEELCKFEELQQKAVMIADKLGDPYSL